MTKPGTPAGRKHMSNTSNGLVVLVTGASSGIGEATALALSAEGARVAVGGPGVPTGWSRWRARRPVRCWPSNWA
ncbi:SDR family NAD(P)-dependent oxidoreductase [Nonomuraea bangladeshensis]|uniref:SDR family NAD(P)-dependent oxidoreductase n=1 Tax=Nonomuraea bangladeshensis TaxID=404385 RepID=UPI003C2BDE25